MRRNLLYFAKQIAILLILATIITLAACTSAPTSTSPPEVTQYAKDWPLSNKDYSNTRATMDSAINSSNVSTLGAAWVFNVPSGQSTFGSISTSPIIMGNTVYIQDLGNNTMALDLATGQFAKMVAVAVLFPGESLVK